MARRDVLVGFVCKVLKIAIVFWVGHQDGGPKSQSVKWVFTTH